MKILKYILGIIALLIIGFLMMGVITSEVSYECNVMVEKPIVESWAVVQDEEKIKEWLPFLTKIEPVSGTPGTVGAVSMIYFDENGQEVSMQETITSIVPNESISMSYTSDFMDMTYQMTMTEEDGNTKITTSSIAAGNGMFSRSMIALMASSFKTQEETNLSLLKKSIEENTKIYE